jgi:Domain of unknown function (DUF4157)
MNFDREHESDHLHRRAEARDLFDVPGRASSSAQLLGGHGVMPSGLVQRAAERDAAGVAPHAESAVATAARSDGFALPTEIQRSFESSLGADLSSVRVHTDGSSGDAAHAVGARAYAVGQDIHFGAGQYDPGSHDGLHLLAHEVAHTVQQHGGSTTRQHKLAVSNPHDAAELEADAAASAMVARQPFDIGGASHAHARALFRDKDSDRTPATIPSPAMASEAEKGESRKRILAAQQAADLALDRVAHYTRDNWAQYIGMTAESPAVVWSPGVLRKSLGMLAGKGIGAATGALSTVGAAALPEIGWLVKAGVEALGAALTGAAVEKIEGGKSLSPDGASSKGREVAIAALRAKLVEIEGKTTECKQRMTIGYQRQLPQLDHRDVDVTTVEEIRAWADADIAASQAIAPTGTALFQDMLRTWVGNSMANGSGAAKNGVNAEDLKKALNLLEIDTHWALQLRGDLVRFGLPTSQADALLTGGGAPRAGEMMFETAVDRDVLARSFASDQSPTFLHLAQGGQFTVRALYTTRQVAPDPVFGNGYTDLASAQYQLMTHGMVGGDKTVVRSAQNLPG